jgi:hypothetical protein
LVTVEKRGRYSSWVQESKEAMILEKMSEEALRCITSKFSNFDHTSQKRIKDSSGRTMVIDYVLSNDADTIFFEFDGPTHYTMSITQSRDLSLLDYCVENEIRLVRIPYFLQPDIRFFKTLYPELTRKYGGFLDVGFEYLNGYWDKKCVLPGDYNSQGWRLFFSTYMKLLSKSPDVAKEILDSLFDNPNRKLNVESILGVDYTSNAEKLQMTAQHFFTK